MASEKPMPLKTENTRDEVVCMNCESATTMLPGLLLRSVSALVLQPPGGIANPLSARWRH